MAKHAGARQAVIAQNVANANTPNYKAQDLGDFRAAIGEDVALKTTRARHISGHAREHGLRATIDEAAIRSPNGNTVSIEQQMLKSIDADRQHSRALAVYQSSLNILKTSIGRGR
jgi:flagellar basal-body rod protein FlgB